MILLVVAMSVLGGSGLVQDALPKRDPSFPPGEYNKVCKLLRRDKGDFDVIELPNATYNSLDVEEKFIYSMMNGEVDMQNCDAVIDAAQHPEMKLTGVWPELFISDQAGWSDRQIAFLKRNRSLVIRKLKPLSRNSDYSCSFQSAVVLLDAWEFIPELISKVDRKNKDWSNLTICLILMRDGHYAPFLKSATYRKLYGPNSNSKSFILANPANIDLTIKRAMDFYHTKWK